jgi:hypothetical protein
MPAQDKKEVLHMKQMINRSIGCAVVLAAAGALFHTRAGAQDLTAITGEQGVHGMPFTGKGEARRSADGGYTTRLPRRPGDDHATTYAIFWAPSRLQNGQTTSMPRRIKTLAEPGR